ncbi:MAG: hypothetical protein IKC43_06815 [Clostridia bacterium]|nr:hypothetical protein [Clostridia bacterium]
MKKRRTLIISLLLVAALALGVGYAYTTGNVSISGEVYNKPHDLNLTFVAEGSAITKQWVEGQDATTASSIVVVDGAETASFVAREIKHDGDYIEAVFVIQNQNHYDVKLNDIEVNYTFPSGHDDFFTVTHEWVTEVGQDLTLTHEEKIKLKVRVEMNGVTGDEIEGRFTLTVPAQSAS